MDDSTTGTRRGRREVRRRSVVVAALAAAAAVAVSAVLVSGAVMQSRDDATPAAAPLASASATADGFSAGGLQDPTAPVADASDDGVPTHVRIPKIGVDSSLENLALGAGGELAAPVDFDLAGWYSGGVVPGEIGPAIIAGHVDSVTQPAVFARIGELSPGDEVIVTMTSGEELTFTITGSTQSSKSNFPTDEVYRNVPRPELRLITCAGDFDSSIGHYTDNLILFAALSA
ncbi:sortase [Planococcus sp. APC 4015]|nr:sortase [Planococcus sp. APC 4015]